MWPQWGEELLEDTLSVSEGARQSLIRKREGMNDFHKENLARHGLAPNLLTHGVPGVSRPLPLDVLILGLGREDLRPTIPTSTLLTLPQLQIKIWALRQACNRLVDLRMPQVGEAAFHEILNLLQVEA